MCCDGDCCLVFIGEIGKVIVCGIYVVWFEVCCICMLGDVECVMVWWKFGLLLFVIV